VDRPNIQVNSSGVASSTGGRNGSRWYEISNLTGTPSLVQSGTLFDPASANPRGFWIPSVAASGQGHMALGCGYAGTNDFAGSPPRGFHEPLRDQSAVTAGSAPPPQLGGELTCNPPGGLLSIGGRDPEEADPRKIVRTCVAAPQCHVALTGGGHAGDPEPARIAEAGSKRVPDCTDWECPSDC